MRRSRPSPSIQCRISRRLAEVKLISWICPVTQIHGKIEWVLPWPVRHPATEFHENFSRLCIILLKVKQTDTQTNRTKNITLLGGGNRRQPVLNEQLKSHNTTNWKSRRNTKTIFMVEGARVVAVPPLRSPDAPVSVRVFQVSWGLAAAPGLATKWPSQAVNAAPQICPGDFPKKVLNQEFAEVFWPTRQTLCQSFLCWLDYSCHEWESVQAESSIRADSSEWCVNQGSRTLCSSERPICIPSFEAERKEKAFRVV